MRPVGVEQPPTGNRLPSIGRHKFPTLLQDVCDRIRDLCSGFTWAALKGPGSVTPDCALVKSTKVAFAEAVGRQWVKKASGAKYGSGVKVCGWHMYNCSLREVETAAEEDKTGQ